MKPIRPIPRWLALFLALALADPSPALALRVSQEGTGLEELLHASDNLHDTVDEQTERESSSSWLKRLP